MDSTMPGYHHFAELAELHRRFIGQVDQKVGREKAVMRKYIAAIDRRLARYPPEYYDRWRKEQGMGDARRYTDSR